jgi:hypothetical protein
VITPFLGDALFARLQKYSDKLANGAARGRTVNEIMEESSMFETFSIEVEQFVASYSAPDFTADENTLIKLKAFLDSKLPG